jgi:DNA-damage-inducible protein J
MARKLRQTSSSSRPKTGMIRARVDPMLKARVEGILGKLGLSASDAIRLFYAQVALSNGLPFEVKIPNTLARKIPEDAGAGKDLADYGGSDEIFKDLDL